MQSQVGLPECVSAGAGKSGYMSVDLSVDNDQNVSVFSSSTFVTVTCLFNFMPFSHAG